MQAKIIIRQADSGFNQGLRTGLGVSLLSGMPLHASGLKDDNPRSRPGLGRESLNLLALLARASKGKFVGVVGEPDISFTPGEFLEPQFTLSLSGLRFSEAPLSWVVETLLPALNNQSQVVDIQLSGGGTHVFGGPTSEEVNQLILPLWREIGFNIQYTEVATGFHPNASGEAEITLRPHSQLKPLQLLEPFVAKSFGAHAVIAGLPVYLAEQSLAAASQRFARHGVDNAQIDIRRPLSGQGQAVMVWADNGRYRVGYSILGRKGARLDSMAGQAVDDLFSFLNRQAAVPARQAVWCLLPLSQAKGESKLLLDRPSSALRAAMGAINKARPGCVSLKETEHGPLLRVKGNPWEYRAIK